MTDAELRLLLDDGVSLPGERCLENETPFLTKHLGEVRMRRLVDLGCGFGEHARYFATQGFQVVAVDASRHRLDKAAEPAAGGGNPQWIQGEMGAVEALVSGRFGAALVLGNSLAHILGAESLSRLLIGLRRRMLPGAPLVIHQHNYDRIFARNLRHLPTSTVKTPEGNRLALRLLDPRDDGYVVFTGALLDHHPEAEDPVRITQSYSMHLRGWKLDELDAALSVAQFAERRFYGGFNESRFEAEESAELICVAR